MTKVTSGKFTREFGRYRVLAQREPVIITSHGRDDVVLLAAEDYARLRRDEQKAFHVSQLSREVVDELGKIPTPKAATLIEKVRQQRKPKKSEDRER